MIWRSFLVIALCVFTLSLAAPAAELWELTPYTGDPIGLTIEVQQDAVLADTLRITATVDSVNGNNLGDIRAIYFNIDGGSAGVTESMFSSPDVSSFVVCTGSGITQCGSADTNLNGPTDGLFPAGAFDVGIEVGDPGIGGGDDYQMATFLFNYGTLGLTAEDLGPFAARITSVGTAGDREGSSKLFDEDGPTTVPDEPDQETPIPEPSAWTMILVGIGLLGGTRFAKKRRQNT